MAKKNKTSSLSNYWNDADPADASNLLPAGNHKVRLNSLKLQEKEGKGTSAALEFEAIEGEFEGKKVTQYYQLIGADGEQGKGVVYLKAALGLLERGEVDGDELEAEFEKITEEQPLVIIRVWDSGQYKNAAIVGLAEGDLTQAADADADDGPAEIEEGSNVTWEDKAGNELKGVVKEIKGEKAVVTDEDGDDIKVLLSKLTLATADAEEVTAQEIEVGSSVTWTTKKGAEMEGTVKKIVGDIATVVDEDGDKFPVSLDDLTLKAEEQEQKAEAYEPEAGDDVEFTDPDDDAETLEGEVTKVKGDVVTIKVGKKEYKVDKAEVKKA